MEVLMYSFMLNSIIVASSLLTASLWTLWQPHVFCKVGSRLHSLCYGWCIGVIGLVYLTVLICGSWYLNFLCVWLWWEYIRVSPYGPRLVHGMIDEDHLILNFTAVYWLILRAIWLTLSGFGFGFFPVFCIRMLVNPVKGGCSFWSTCSLFWGPWSTATTPSLS